MLFYLLQELIDDTRVFFGAPELYTALTLIPPMGSMT